MKCYFLCSALIVLLISSSLVWGSEVIKFKHANQSDEPVIFAPGIISTGQEESSITFTPDGINCYLVIQGSIYFSKFVGGQWSEPVLAPFSGKYMDITPHISPDGARFYWTSYRPLDGGEEPSKYTNIWYMDKIGDGWSEPKPVGPPVNGEYDADSPSVTCDGTLYFGAYFEDVGARVLRSRMKNGEFTKPELLPETINHGSAFHGCIAPDESYLVIPMFGKKDSYGSTDYYISFRDKDDNWTPVINMGKAVNSSKVESGPYITADGKYFFFGGYADPVAQFDEPVTYQKILSMHTKAGYEKGDIYWVSSSYIEKLRAIAYQKNGDDQ
ncbi:MAG: PD40 domain-containing protein [Acidobacteria bacterium]|nr:PD40 domain-containing protein [Acidobacteriota bacterium]